MALRRRRGKLRWTCNEECGMKEMEEHSCDIYLACEDNPTQQSSFPNARDFFHGSVKKKLTGQVLSSLFLFLSLLPTFSLIQHSHSSPSHGIWQRTSSFEFLEDHETLRSPHPCFVSVPLPLSRSLTRDTLRIYLSIYLPILSHTQFTSPAPSIHHTHH